MEYRTLMNILFLHTLSSNTQIFSPLASTRFPEHKIHHDVQEHFLSNIREQGPTQTIIDEINQYLFAKLASGFDFIICTCSTLGSIVDCFPNNNVFRVDKPMADICSNYPNVLVVVTLQSTIEPSKALFESASSQTHFKFLYVERAWEHYMAKQFDAFNQSIAQSIDNELDATNNSYDAIILAQASMVTATSLIRSSLPLLTSPDSCLNYLESVLEKSSVAKTKLEDN